MKSIRSRLQVESLEGRDCPSVTLSLQNGGHTLLIAGDSSDNNVQITQDDANDSLAVTADMSFLRSGAGEVPPERIGTQTFRSSQITQVIVKLGAGNDTLSYQLAPGSNYRYAKVFNINMGDGNNTISFDTCNPQMGVTNTQGDVTRPQMTDPQIQANMRLAICTGAGHDQVQVNLGEIANHASVVVSARLGAGDDSFSLISCGDIHAGSKLTVDVDGGLGNDTLFTSMRGTVEDKAFVSIFLRGNQGDDQTTVEQNSLLLGKMTVVEWGGAGKDNLAVTANSQTGSNGNLSVREFGDQGDDSLTFNPLTAPNAGINLFNGLLAGGDGTDTAHISQFSQAVPMSSIELIEYLNNDPGKGGGPAPV